MKWIKLKDGSWVNSDNCSVLVIQIDEVGVEPVKYSIWAVLSGAYVVPKEKPVSAKYLIADNIATYEAAKKKLEGIVGAIEGFMLGSAKTDIKN